VADRVDVYRIDLEAAAPLEATCRGLLSADELQRADRFHQPRHRRQFAVTRGVLRALLARRLGRSAVGLRFVDGPHGKPALADTQPLRLEFNVAHSHGLALVALSVEHAVGVDVERIRPEVDLDGIAGRFFAPLERDELAAVAPGRRADAFFACWSRKEAVLKAVGTGISGGLARYAVSCDPRSPARLLAVDCDGPPPEEWTLADIEAGAGFCAAVAVMAPAVEVCCHDWSPQTDFPDPSHP